MASERTVMRLVCVALTAFYTARYWLRGGVLSFTVDGHAYGEVTHRRGELRLPEYAGPVEFEDAACERCGHVDTAWRRSAL